MKGNLIEVLVIIFNAWITSNKAEAELCQEYKGK